VAGGTGVGVAVGVGVGVAVAVGAGVALVPLPLLWQAAKSALPAANQTAIRSSRILILAVPRFIQPPKLIQPLSAEPLSSSQLTWNHMHLRFTIYHSLMRNCHIWTILVEGILLAGD